MNQQYETYRDSGFHPESTLVSILKDQFQDGNYISNDHTEEDELVGEKERSPRGKGTMNTAQFAGSGRDLQIKLKSRKSFREKGRESLEEPSKHRSSSSSYFESSPNSENSNLSKLRTSQN